jgi:L-aminoadipate-semialdehyde dehydrogenase
VLTKKFVGYLNNIAVDCKIINMYGSTESQRSVTYYIVPNPNKEKEKFNKLKNILPVGVGINLIINN